MGEEKYLGYIRVSTNGQAQDGYGLAIQEQTIRDWFGDRHRRLTIHRDEGVSGRILDRPGLSGLLRSIERNDIVVVPRLDRLARDLISQELLLAEIQRQGGKLISCSAAEQPYLEDDTEDPSRRFVRQILGAVSEYERAMVTLRLRGGRRAKRASGGFGGGETPFGWRVADAGGLEVDEREQAVLDFITDAREHGASYAEIATRLNRRSKLHPRRGSGVWTKQGVFRVAGRPFVPAMVPPDVDAVAHR
jgi:DNA invertase Pin-like site-specific DNA recombinase